MAKKVQESQHSSRPPSVAPLEENKGVRRHPHPAAGSAGLDGVDTCEAVPHRVCQPFSGLWRAQGVSTGGGGWPQGPGVTDRGPHSERPIVGHSEGTQIKGEEEKDPVLNREGWGEWG